MEIELRSWEYLSELVEKMAMIPLWVFGKDFMGLRIYTAPIRLSLLLIHVRRWRPESANGHFLVCQAVMGAAALEFEFLTHWVALLGMLLPLVYLFHRTACPS